MESQAQKKKIFRFYRNSIRGIWIASRPTQRGVGHRHDEGRVAVDADVPETSGADAYGKDVWSWRRGAGVKLAVRPADDGGKRAVLRGDHVISRKAIAQGMSDVLRCPCM